MPLSNKNWNTAGSFVKDQSGKICLAHSGRTGGPRGVSMETFKKKFPHKKMWHLVEGKKSSKDLVVIGKLENEKLLSKLGAFISDYLKIKEGRQVSNKHKFISKYSQRKNTRLNNNSKSKTGKSKPLQKSQKKQKRLSIAFRKAKSQSDLDAAFEKEEQKAVRTAATMTKKQREEWISNYKGEHIPSSKVSTIVYFRDPKLAEMMKKKNKYTCQLCKKPTFVDKYNNYYVESHHVVPRAKNGADMPKNILIVCPTCHKIFDSGNAEEQIHAYKKLRSQNIFNNFKVLLKNSVITGTMYERIINSS
jgi:predicted restriction endonuclease